MFALLVCSVLAQAAEAPALKTTERSARLLEARPTTQQLVVRALIAPLSAAGGTGTGMLIGAGIGFGLGFLGDLVTLARGRGPLMLGAANFMSTVGAIIGGVIGYLLGSSSPGQLFETSLSARKRAVLWGLLVTVITGTAWLVAVLTGTFVVALPWLIAGGVVVSVAVPVFSDLSRPRVDAVSVATF